MTLNLGMSGSNVRGLPFLKPGPVPLPAQELIQLPTPMTFVVNPGSPLLLSPFPTISPVTGDAGHGARNPEPGVFIVQVGPEAELVASAKQPAFITQGTPNWGAAGSLPGGPGYPAPLISSSSVKKTLVPTTASSVTQAVQGGVGPQAPPPEAQMPPIVLPFNGGPQTVWITGDNGVAPVQSKATFENVHGSRSVYANFRLWQLYKPLAGLCLPQTPNTEAFACFLIPVLRSLGRLKPTMTVEEGLGKAIREWQCISKSEKVTYYEMAAKFMEFETEEQMQAPKLQCSTGEQGLQSSTLPKPELQGAPPPVTDQQSVCVPRNASPQALAALPPKHKDQSLPRTQTPSEIPVEAVQEYIDIMDELLKDHAVEETGKEVEEEDRPWSNPNMLSYLDELCSQKDFVTKVETIIDHRFLGHLLSPDPQLEISTLAAELEEVEGFNPSQLTDENLQALHDEQTEKAHLGHRHQMTPKDSSPEGTAIHHGAPTPIQAHRPRATTATCGPTSSSGQTPRPVIQLATEASEPKSSHCPHPVLPTLGSRADHILEKDPLGIMMPGSKESSEEEEDLPSLAFLLAPCQSRQPCGLPLWPAPGPSPHNPRNSAGLRSCTPSRRANQTSDPNTAPSKKRRRLELLSLEVLHQESAQVKWDFVFTCFSRLVSCDLFDSNLPLPYYVNSPDELQT